MKEIDQAFAPLQEREATEPPRSSDAWRPIMPVPEDAPPLTRTLVDRCELPGYSFTKSWRYLDKEGRLLGRVVRYDRIAEDGRRKKDYEPFTFCAGRNGRREWRSKGFPEPRPLYGLNGLAARLKAPVLLVEGEKAADAAVKLFPEHVPTTSPGGSGAALKADWSSLAGREVTIWRDADEPGIRYADHASEMLRQVGAASIRSVDIPTDFPDGWDLADELPAGYAQRDLARMLAEARPVRAEAPLPLFPPLPPAERYPIEALGPVLAPAAAAIARKVRVPEAIAAQSVLAAASLAAQAHADVMLPFGQRRPLSLYLITVAGSGDRKTTADNEALCRSANAKRC